MAVCHIYINSFSNIVFNFKNLNLRIGSAASDAGQGKLTLVYLPWPPRESRLSILTFALLFRHVRKFGF